MEWQSAAGRPVYIQLVEQLERAVVTGVYPPGERVPAVRDLAAQAQVNPNTMQRALAEMESRGLLVTQRTTGRTVTSDTALIAKTRQALAASLAQDFLAQAKALGLTREEILALKHDSNLYRSTSDQEIRRAHGSARCQLFD